MTGLLLSVVGRVRIVGAVIVERRLLLLLLTWIRLWLLLLEEKYKLKCIVKACNLDGSDRGRNTTYRCPLLVLIHHLIR